MTLPCGKAEHPNHYVHSNALQSGKRRFNVRFIAAKPNNTMLGSLYHNHQLINSIEKIKKKPFSKRKALGFS